MSPERSDAERCEVVRQAAKSWFEAGFVDARGLETIKSLYPDDRRRLGAVWRVPVFLFVLIAVVAVFAALNIATSLSDNGLAAVSLVFGLALAAATEIQQGRLRIEETGSDTATSFLSIGFLLASCVYFLSQLSLPEKSLL